MLVKVIKIVAEVSMPENQAVKFIKTAPVNTFDCDFQGNWKPAAFVQNLSEAAVDHAEALGVGYQAMLSKGYYWVLSRLKVKFLGFPHPGERVRIETWPKSVQQRLFYIRDFELFDQTGSPVALASSAWLVIDASARRLVAPASLSELRLPQSPEMAALNEPLEKLNLSEEGVPTLRQRANYSSVDLVGHVNNTRYVEAICDSLEFNFYRENRIDWLQINFEKEVRPQEELEVRKTILGDSHDLYGFVGLNLSSQSRAFEAVVHTLPTTIEPIP